MALPIKRRRRHLFLVILAAAIALALHSQRGLLKVGSGWVAKRACSGIFVAGRSRASLDELALPLPLPVSIEVSRDAKNPGVTARVGGLFAPSSARYRAELGCVLEESGAVPQPLDALPDGRLSPVAPRKQLRTGAAPAALQRVVESAFVRTPEQEAAGYGTRAVVILRDGEVVGERYAEGFSARTPLEGWSMAKSVTGTLVGILVDAGRIDVHTPVGLAAWSEPEDPRRAITWDHLLRMSSGLLFTENYRLPSENAIQMLFGAGRLAKGAYAAGLPLEHEVDTHWSYSSGTTNLLHYALLERVFGGDVGAYLDFPRHALFARLGMSSAVMEPDASGVYVGSSFLFATARDWARFGQLYLNDGVFEGERVLSSEWVRYSGTPTNAEGSYGAHWWLNADPVDRPRRWPGVDANVLIASGFEGQGVVVVPESGLVVVRLGYDGANRLDMGDFVERIVGSFSDAL